MTSTVETLSSVKKKINFEIPAERVSTEIDKVYGEIRKRAAVKGFRKGKMPHSLVEKHYSSAMEGDVLKNLFDETYYKALADHKIFPVSHPVLESDEVKRGVPLKYSATVEVLPDIEVKDYVGLGLKKELFRADESVVEQRLNEMRESMAQIVPAADGVAAEQGNFVVIDFTGYIGDDLFEGGAAESYELELGAARFIPGFEEQLIGACTGDQRTVRVTFPAEYWKSDLAGKEARFEVTVKEVKAKELPALNDEFAHQFGEFETLDQLRAKMAELYEKQEQERIKAELQDRVVTALIAKNQIEVPTALVDRQLKMMLSNAKNRLASQRLSLEMMGMDEEKFKEQYRSVAESQVKGSLLLDAIAKLEQIKINEDDIHQRLREMAGESDDQLERMKSYYDQNHNARENLEAHLKEEKVMSFLIEKADVTEVAKEEL